MSRDHVSHSFVGRQADLDSLRAMVGEGAPLITVLGPAGIGKSRLARELAAVVEEEVEQRWLCDLTEARGPLDAVGAIARDVGAGLDGSADLEQAMATLASTLHDSGRCLLVLDNFEQLVDSSVGVVERLLGGKLTLLVTSRERLRIRGEQVLDLDALSADDAAALFVERARAVRHDYAPAPGDEDVRAICAELDGLPLAIELAAARIRVLSASELQKRLRARFELLTSSPRGTSRRHATLKGALDWSWDLLTPSERAALMQCAAFEGGFTVDAAEAVVSLDMPDAPAVIDVLEGLRDKSLLRLDQRENGLRFGLYLSIRDYARDKLEAEGIAAVVERRHAEHYLAQGLIAAARAEGKDSASARQYIMDERDNLLAVHRRALTPPVDPEHALRAAMVVQPVLITGGPAALRLWLLDSALERVPGEFAGDSPLSQLSGWARLARADCLLQLGRLEEAAADLDLAFAKAEQHGDDWLGGRCQWRLGTRWWMAGQLDRALSHVDTAVKIFTRARDEIHVGRCLGSMGLVHAARGDVAAARAAYGRALKLHRARGDGRWIATTTGRLAELDDAEGKLDEAERRYGEAIDGHREQGNQRHLSQVLATLGALELERGDVAGALAHFEDALALQARVPDRRAEVLCRADKADALALCGERDRAEQELDLALDVSRSLSNARLEAIVLARMARLRMRFDGADALDAAEEWLDAAAARCEGDELASAVVILARAHLSIAREDRDGGRAALDEVSLVVARHALARREAAHLIDALEDKPPQGVLVVSSSGEWFHTAEGERIDLRKRRSLRLVLRALLRQRFNHPGVALSTNALFEAGWPGERAQSQAATSRVYVALSTLRKLGLRDALIKREEGYLLDDALPLKRW